MDLRAQNNFFATHFATIVENRLVEIGLKSQAHFRSLGLSELLGKDDSKTPKRLNVNDDLTSVIVVTCDYALANH